MFTYMCMYLCALMRLELDLFSLVTLHLVYRGEVSHSNPELNDSARLAGWLTLGPRLCLLGAEITNGPPYLVTLTWILGFPDHIFTSIARTLPTEPSP